MRLNGAECARASRDSWCMTTDETAAPVAGAVAGRRVLGREIWLVLALSLGASAVAAVISFAGVVTSAKPISGQTAVIVGSRAPGRPWLDLSWQIFAVVTALVPVALVGH